MDPFAVLGVPPSMALDLDDLDRRYLELSRACHPDHSGAVSPEEQVAVLERSARLNDAYRELRDPWRRAARILELRAPGVMDRTRRLRPEFLGEAMELSEEVAEARGEAVDSLRQRIAAQVAADLAAIAARIDGGDLDGAATLLHQARYRRKALDDLKVSA